MIQKLQAKVKDFSQILEKFPEVRYAGDPVLRMVAQTVSIKEGIEIGKRLGDILMRYRKEVGYGRGFAAPQIGENKAVFVTFVDENLEIFINPKIVEKSTKTNFYKELCLSSGIMAVDTERPEWIIMEWLDISGETHMKKFDDFLARLYQHEESHLQGRLNLDEAAEGGIEFAFFNPLSETLRTKRF